MRDGQALGSERFVGLDQIHIGDGQAGLFHDLAGGGHGAHAHDGGIDAAQRTGDPGGHGGDAQFLGLLLAHDDQRGGAVVDGGSVAGGDFAVLLEGGAQLGQDFRRAQAGTFVGVKDDVALLVLDDHGHDLVLERAGLDGSLGLGLALESKVVQIFTAQVPLVGHVLSGDAHVVVVEGVPQRVVDHGVHQFALAHGGAHAVAVTALHHGEGGHIHVLGAARDHDVGVAGFDHLGRHVDAVQAGAADHVDGDSRSGDRQAGLDAGLTGHVLAQARLDDAAHVDMVDLLRLDAGAVDGLLDDDGAQLGSRDVGQRAAEFADGSTAGAGNDDLFHK